MIFQLVQKNLSILGISKAQSVRLFRIKVSIGCLLLGTNFIIHFKFLLDEANSFREYSESTYMLNVTVMVLWCYANLIRQRVELLEFIDKTEKLLILCRESKFVILFVVHIQFGQFFVNICVMCNSTFKH